MLKLPAIVDGKEECIILEVRELQSDRGSAIEILVVYTGVSLNRYIHTHKVGEIGLHRSYEITLNMRKLGLE